MFVGSKLKRILHVRVEVLYEGQMTPGGCAYLVLDGVQHLNVQQLKLNQTTQTFAQLASRVHW